MGYERLEGRTSVPASDDASAAQSAAVAGPSVVVVVGAVVLDTGPWDLWPHASSASPAPSAAVATSDVWPARRRNSRRLESSAVTSRRYFIFLVKNRCHPLIFCTDVGSLLLERGREFH
jgi:hypothetical protein